MESVSDLGSGAFSFLKGEVLQDDVRRCLLGRVYKKLHQRSFPKFKITLRRYLQTHSMRQEQITDCDLKDIMPWSEHNDCKELEAFHPDRAHRCPLCRPRHEGDLRGIAIHYRRLNGDHRGSYTSLSEFAQP